MASKLSSVSTDLRLAELLMALSLATDFGMGQSVEFALQSCMLAMRLGQRLGFSEPDLRATYYQALLRYIGCNAETHLLAAVFGDELALRQSIIHADSTSPEFFSIAIRFIREANAGASALQLLRAITTGLMNAGRATQEIFAGHCEVASRLAERLGLEPYIVQAMSQVYARWDGQGIPALKGEAVAPSMLAVSLAQDAVYVYRLAGAEAALAMVQKRKGTLYAPQHVEQFTQHRSELFMGFEAEPMWEVVLALEPGPRHYLTETEFDTACAAMADFTDFKSPYLLGHSPGVAQLAASAAQHCGLPEADWATARRASLLHDLGRVGVSAGIWGKAGALSDREWEAVRLHPYHTERILARPATLAQLGAIASLHHERLDGSGYHRGTLAAALSPLARILAAADVYHALTETRPHREAYTPEAAADHLRREARAGRLDPDAVNGVLTAAGHRLASRRKDLVAGLSEREVEVLRLVARGHSIKQIAAQLSVAPKTVDNHIQHIYAKTGATTRAGATLFAMENNLL